MPDSWIDRDELEQLAGAFSPVKKGRFGRASQRPKSSLGKRGAKSSHDGTEKETAETPSVPVSALESEPDSSVAESVLLGTEASDEEEKGLETEQKDPALPGEEAVGADDFDEAGGAVSVFEFDDEDDELSILSPEKEEEPDDVSVEPLPEPIFAVFEATDEEIEELGGETPPEESLLEVASPFFGEESPEEEIVLVADDLESSGSTAEEMFGTVVDELAEEEGGGDLFFGGADPDSDEAGEIPLSESPVKVEDLAGKDVDELVVAATDEHPEAVAVTAEIEVMTDEEAGLPPARPVPAFLDDSDDDWDRPISVSQRDADRALLALAEARARVDRFELIFRRAVEVEPLGEETFAGEETGPQIDSEAPFYGPGETESFVAEISVEEDAPPEDEPPPLPSSLDETLDEAVDEAVDDDLEEEDPSQWSFLERIARFGEKSRRLLGAESVSICDRDGFPLYSASEGSGGTGLDATLLLDVSGRADRLLGLEAGQSTQVSPDGVVWHCLIRCRGEAGDLYAGFQLRRPLEPEEIEVSMKSLAEVVTPASVKGRDL